MTTEKDGGCHAMPVTDDRHPNNPMLRSMGTYPDGFAAAPQVAQEPVARIKVRGMNRALDDREMATRTQRCFGMPSSPPPPTAPDMKKGKT